MTDKALIENLKIEKKKWENKVYSVGETRIDMMIEDTIKVLQNKQAELEKKDKIIDEMAKVLADYKYEEIICMEVDCEHIELQNEGKCIGDEACIKEYFKKKVEDK